MYSFCITIFLEDDQSYLQVLNAIFETNNRPEGFLLEGQHIGRSKARRAVQFRGEGIDKNIDLPSQQGNLLRALTKKGFKCRIISSEYESIAERESRERLGEKEHPGPGFRMR